MSGVPEGVELGEMEARELRMLTGFDGDDMSEQQCKSWSFVMVRGRRKSRSTSSPSSVLPGFHSELGATSRFGQVALLSDKADSKSSHLYLYPAVIKYPDDNSQKM